MKGEEGVFGRRRGGGKGDDNVRISSVVSAHTKQGETNKGRVGAKSIKGKCDYKDCMTMKHKIDE